MTFNEIVKDIKAKKYSPIYFLSGEEAYFIDVITDLLESSVLTENEKDFNFTMLYGNDVNIGTVIDSARRYPVMSEKQVVIVKEAQNIRDYDGLLPYVQHYLDSTILVFAYKNKKVDKRLSVFKTLASSKECVFFESNKIPSYKLTDWVFSYCKEKNYKINTKAASLLSESLGSDLNKLVNEIDKLLLFLPSGKEIDENVVEENIGISKDFNNFELIDAIIYKDVLKANRIINYFAANPKKSPLLLTASVIFGYFLNLLTYHYEKKNVTNQQEMAKLLGVSPYFMKNYTNGASKYSAKKCVEVISCLREYDMKSKGKGAVNVSDGELLKEMFFKILH